MLKILQLFFLKSCKILNSLKHLAKSFREKNILGIRQNSLKVLAKSFREFKIFEYKKKILYS